MSILEKVLLALGLWFAGSYLLTGIWMLVRSYYIRKHKREDAKKKSNDDIVFATVQEFRNEFSPTS